jgi:hypothetical protein
MSDVSAEEFERKLEDGELIQLPPEPPPPPKPRARYTFTAAGQDAKRAARHAHRRRVFAAIVDGLRRDLGAYRRLRVQLQKATHLRARGADAGKEVAGG